MDFSNLGSVFLPRNLNDPRDTENEPCKIEDFQNDDQEPSVKWDISHGQPYCDQRQDVRSHSPILDRHQAGKETLLDNLDPEQVSEYEFQSLPKTNGIEQYYVPVDTTYNNDACMQSDQVPGQRLETSFDDPMDRSMGQNRQLPRSALEQRQEYRTTEGQAHWDHRMHWFDTSVTSHTSNSDDVDPSSLFGTDISSAESSSDHYIAKSTKSGQAIIRPKKANIRLKKALQSVQPSNQDNSHYSLQQRHTMRGAGDSAASNVQICMGRSTPIHSDTVLPRGRCSPPPKFNENEQFLPPLSPRPSPSEVSSSRASSMDLPCNVNNCKVRFNGESRKGNLARHKRQFHEGSVIHRCEDSNCNKSFRRPDARLVHYRKCHPYLAPAPVVTRKISTQTTPVNKRDFGLTKVSA